ncbi:MAG: hypothetical protein U0R19_39125 [Bryobacteraceae bacterium]
MTEKTIVVLETAAEQCSAEIYLNRVPVALVGGAWGKTLMGAAVPEHLIDGENELAILVNPGKTPSQALTGRRMMRAPGATAYARLVRYPVGAYSGDPRGQQLVRLDFAANTEGKEELFPMLGRRRFAMDVKWHKWRWLDAPRLTLDDATRTEVWKLLAAVHRALDRRDTGAVAEMCRIWCEECNLAHDVTPGRKALDLELNLDAVVNDPDSPLDNLREEDFDLRLVGEGRMIDCVARDWNPILRTVPDNGEMSYLSLMVARIDGRMQIVR